MLIVLGVTIVIPYNIALMINIDNPLFLILIFQPALYLVWGVSLKKYRIRSKTDFYFSLLLVSILGPVFALMSTSEILEDNIYHRMWYCAIQQVFFNILLLARDYNRWFL